MDKKVYIGLAIVVIAVLAIVAVNFNSDSSQNANGTITITDAVWRNVTVPTNVEKVVGVGCTAREIVYLDSKDKIVGIEYMESDSQGAWGNELPYIKANEDLKKLPVIGNAKTDTVDYEKLASLKPDVVFAGTPEQAELIQKKTGIPVVVTYVGAVGTDQQMEKYKNTLTFMGEILDKKDRAKELTDYIDETQKDLKSRTEKAEAKKKVYIAGQAFYGVHGVTSTNPYYPTFFKINNVAEGIGGKNATMHAIQIDKEQLVQWNPDYIFVEGASLQLVKEDINKNPDYKNIAAVKDKNVDGLLTYCLYCYNKEEMFANDYYMGKVLYPEEFKDVDVDKKSEEIFAKFNGDGGKEASKEIIKHYNAFKKVDL